MASNGSRLPSAPVSMRHAPPAAAAGSSSLRVQHASLPSKPAASASTSQQQQRQRHGSPAAASSSSNRGRAGRGGAAGGRGGASSSMQQRSSISAQDEQHEKEKQARKLAAYGPEVYSVQEDSIREDWSLNYLNTGQRPQNLLKGVKLEGRFSEYPKLAKLLEVHSALVTQHACPPTYLSLPDLRKQPSALGTALAGTKLDCIVLDLPLEEYGSTYPGRFSSSDSPDAPRTWTWDEIAALPLAQVANNPGFVWLWVGEGKADPVTGVSGLDKGRELLAKWGYRRCEDIVWLKTNVGSAADGHGLSKEPPTSTLLTHTKEHCLMGIRGTVRRSTDGHFVHCNVDTDVIVWEGDSADPLKKPEELYHLVENFCMGTRRLEICGHGRTRRGWLTVDVSAAASTEAVQDFDPATFTASGAPLVPTTAEVDSLRPRSPGPPTAAKAQTLAPPTREKTNPQGIGRHTNRSATPSASMQLAAATAERERERERQALEQQQMQVQQQQQQQQWAMQQAHFMSMFQNAGNPMMGMGMPMPYGAMPMGMGMPMHMQMPGVPMMGYPGPQPQQHGFPMGFQQGYPQQQDYGQYAAGQQFHMQGQAHGHGQGQGQQGQYGHQQ